VGIPGKRCASCGEFVPLSWYYRRKSGPYAGNTIEYCRPCCLALSTAATKRKARALQAQVAAQETWTQPPRVTAEDVASVRAHYNSRARRG
jgi:hypothetical protein